MVIKKNMKMAVVIHENHHLLPIISRFDIQLGFGEKTVEYICLEKGIEVEFFLDIVNSYIDEKYFPKKHLAAFSSSQILKYLKNTHQYYTNEKIPLIEKLIKKLVQTSKAEKQKLKLIENFFSEYKEELIAHMQKEDDEVYPYILEVEKYYSGQFSEKEVEDFLSKYSINDFADEHDNMEEKLYDLKNILVKYLPEQDDQALLHTIIMELFELEKDLSDHARIEDKVLVPKIARMEKKLKENTY